MQFKVLKSFFEKSQEERFYVVCSDGSIDDAHGYGYTSFDRAVTVGHYREKKLLKTSEKEVVKNFLKEHCAFSKKIDDTMFENIFTKGEKFTYHTLSEIAKADNIKLPFRADKFFKLMNEK